MAISLSNLLQQFMQERQQQYGQGLSSLQSVANLFGPGAMAGDEAAAGAAIEQSAASRGLSGTTLPVAQSVGMKQQSEGIRKSRLADAITNLTSFIQGNMPTTNTLAGLASQSASLSQRQAETAPGAQWAMGVSPAAMSHQQGVAGALSGGRRGYRSGGTSSGITRWR